MMIFQKVIINFAYRIRPLLIKILPTGCLKKLKDVLVKNSSKQFTAYKKQLFVRNAAKDGINLLGSIQADTGLGQSCRLLAAEVSYSKIPYSIYNYKQLGNIEHTEHSFDTLISSQYIYNINLIHINPREFSVAFSQLDLSLLDKKYNIAFWLWELEEFPDEWLINLNLLDEIWTPSEFISKSIRAKTKLPVITVPYSITAQVDKSVTRKEFGLPENVFLFLVMYDNGSISERKNPIGAIKTFQKAFLPEDLDCGLVIKVNHASKSDIDKLKDVCGKYRNIYFITENLHKLMVNSLIANIDVLLSLHRAEGFGLVLAEAMYLGIPVVATNWSANTEFMSSETSCMVDYTKIILDKDYGPFKKGQYWADPDLTQASQYMKRLKHDKDFYQDISKKGKQSIREKLNIDTISNLISCRVDEIYKTKQ